MSATINNELIKQLKERDRAAFKQFVLSYSSLFFTKAKMYCRNTQDAEDALQDSFVTIYQKLVDFKGNNLSAFIAWCSKIVVHTSIAKYRRNYYTMERNELTEQSDVQIDPTIYQKLNKDELMNLIEKLPSGYRQIFLLFAIEGYSHKEIAEQLNIGASSSRSQYIRAKQKLKDIILSHSPTLNMVS